MRWLLFAVGCQMSVMIDLDFVRCSLHVDLLFCKYLDLFAVATGTVECVLVTCFCCSGIL